MRQRPLVAIVSNALTPYRLHLHRRLIREIPEIQLASLFTHSESTAPFEAAPPADIHPIEFGPGEFATQQSRLRFAWHEWRKGGRVISWLREHGAAGVVVLGYNDPGRRRIIRWCHHQEIPCFLFGDSNVRGDTASGWKRLLKRALLPRILRRCRGVLVCGSLGREYYLKYGVPPERIELFPYEPDYAQIESITPAQIEVARERFGLPETRHFVIYSGRLAPEKRVDLLLDAFAKIASDRPDWDLLIVGGGPLAEELQDRIPKGLFPRVHWLGFLDDQAVLSALYRCARVFVLPSDYEPWAVVINEAVAAGLAVIASDAVGAAADLVRDGVNGRVFPSGDLATLTVCLREVTASDEWERLGRGAASVLADWRAKADPVTGLKRVLQKAGVVSTINS
jgi:glycosyltransferase involved in cell wall biosynthesis